MTASLTANSRIPDAEPTAIRIGEYIGEFHKWGYPQINGLEWFRKENPIKMDDLGVPLFHETSTLENIHTSAMGISIHRCSLWGLRILNRVFR